MFVSLHQTADIVKMKIILTFDYYITDNVEMNSHLEATGFVTPILDNGLYVGYIV
jgi:hypothetical protein